MKLNFNQFQKVNSPVLMQHEKGQPFWKKICKKSICNKGPNQILFLLTNQSKSQTIIFTMFL